MVEIYDNYAFDTEVLVASVRNPIHVVQSARSWARTYATHAAQGYSLNCSSTP